jgi:Kdo2-lipid IVA lauroyltransferase/acyltransferase
MKTHKKIKHFIEYIFVLLVIKPIRMLPESRALKCAEQLGWFVFHFIPVRRKTSLLNLSRAFPQKSKKELQHIALKTYQNFSKTIFEFIQLQQMTKEQLGNRIAFYQPDLLHQAINKNKGTICVSGHFDNWEFMVAAIASENFPIQAVAKPQSNALVDRLIRNTRESKGVTLIKPGVSVRSVLRALKQNKIILLLADQDAHEVGAFVDFLGQPSSTPTGPAVFALKQQAEIVFCISVRQKDNRHHIYFEKIKTDDLKTFNQETVKKLTQRHTKLLENYIREYPDQWFWMHKRWKTTPENTKHEHQ